MKYNSEKEKKLLIAIEGLKKIDFSYNFNKESLESLNNQKNQLKIEKEDIENKFGILKKEHESLKDRLNKIYEEKKKEKIKEMQFSENIDELNQETDMLLDEFNKWET